MTQKRRDCLVCGAKQRVKSLFDDLFGNYFFKRRNIQNAVLQGFAISCLRAGSDLQKAKAEQIKIVPKRSFWFFGRSSCLAHSKPWDAQKLKLRDFCLCFSRAFCCRRHMPKMKVAEAKCAHGIHGTHGPRAAKRADRARAQEHVVFAANRTNKILTSA